MAEPWNPFSVWLRQRFGEKVHRVGLDAGLTCPNRDGAKGAGGCVFCDAGGSRACYQNPALPIPDQMIRGMELMGRRYNVKRFLAYFQAYSNTYAPAGRLLELWKSALVDERVVGFSIATRPDCLAPVALDALSSLGSERFVLLEMGFLSRRQEVLDACNRREELGDFEKAILAARACGIPVCVHIIFGLPGLSLQESVEDAAWLGGLGIQGIKIHNLYIANNAPIAAMWREGKVALPSREEYVHAVCDALELLPWDCKIHRLTGDAPAGQLLAPEWSRNKQEVIEAIRAEFQRRGTRQGFRAKSSS